MDRKRLSDIASRIAAGHISQFDAVNKALAEAKNVDHVRSLLGQYKVQLFKEPAYPHDVPQSGDDLEVGIESVNDVPVAGLHFLRKAPRGWEITGPSK